MTNAGRPTAAKPVARPKSVGNIILQWALTLGSLTAALVGANGLARQEREETAVVVPATVAELPAAAGAQVQIDGLPSLDLPPIPTLPVFTTVRQTFPAQPAARSRSSR